MRIILFCTRIFLNETLLCVEGCKSWVLPAKDSCTNKSETEESCTNKGRGEEYCDEKDSSSGKRVGYALYNAEMGPVTELGFDLNRKMNPLFESSNCETALILVWTSPC